MSSLRSYLVAMAILPVLIACLATAMLVWQLESLGREQAQRQLLDTTRALSRVVDGELQADAATLHALARSEAAQSGDWARLDAEARGLDLGPDAWIVVGDRNGRQLVNTRLPPGAPLPFGRPAPWIWPPLDRGQDHICNITRGYVEPQILCVDAPIAHGGRVTHHISVIFRPRRLESVLARSRLAVGRYTSVLDRDGVVLWRNEGAQQYVGRHVRPELLRAMRTRPSGLQRLQLWDGNEGVVGYSRSPLSGWTFAVAVPLRDIGAAGARAVGYGLTAAVGLLALAGLMGLTAGRRITRAVRRLQAAADPASGGGGPRFQPSGLAEIDAVGAVLEAAVRERDESQERFELAQEVGGIGAWDWDVPNDQGHVTEAYRRMHGLTHVAGPLRLKQVLAVIHPDDLAAYRANLAAGQRTPEPSTNEYRAVHPDGAVRWISAKGRPLYGPDGRVVRAVGVVLDETERKSAEERLRLLMREVDHRANNLMAVVQGAVTLSRGEDAEGLRETILGRLQALARAHQLLAESRWNGADLRRLIEEEMLPYSLGDGERVQTEGPALPLRPAAAQGVAMALHELATNAAKHGALTAPAGRVRITWRVTGGRLRIRWEETGGPEITAPARRGFGTTVLQRALGGALGGEVRLDWRPEGLACDLELPADA